MSKRAFVTGCNGQTGSYLCELLLAKGYTVFGLVRRTSTQNTWRIDHLLDRLTLLEGDLLDMGSLRTALQKSDPEEVYNFAAQSHVGTSFFEPLHTMEVTGLGPVRLYETVRTTCSKLTRIFQASSSEQYGTGGLLPYNEETPMYPVSPYGAAKLYAHQMAHVYRMAYGQFIACGISFNHESPRRGTEFVTRKITQAVARIEAGQQDLLTLGNLYAKRDWSHAKDIALGAWLTLQHPVPDDFVFASGVSYSVQDFVEYAFNYLSLDWQKFVKTIPTLMRPTEIPELVGHAGKAAVELGWAPSVTFHNLIKEMVDADCARLNPRDSRASDLAPRLGSATTPLTLSGSTNLPEGGA